MSKGGQESRELLALVARAGAPLLPAGSRLLCAVSGGGDSAALSHLCGVLGPRWGLAELALVHVDHRLRESSRVDAATARALAGVLGLPFHLLEVEVGPGAGPEDAARRARYEALGRFARHRGFDRVAVGHTATDQAETVLLRLLRGTGVKGLGAMAPSRRLTAGVRLVRPLLGASRRLVRAHAEKLGLPVCEDPTNADLALRRNALRAAWGALESISPALERQLCRLAESCREDERLLDGLARAALEMLGPVVAATGGRTLVLEAERLAALPTPVANRVARHLVRRLRPQAQPSREQVERLVGLARSGRGGELHLTGDLAARGRGGRIELGPRQRPAPSPFSYRIEGPGRWECPAAGLVLHVEPRGSGALPEGCTLELSEASARFPLELRSRRPGDRFRPSGGAGSRKLKRFLIDVGVPREERDRVALLCQGEEILWVVGLRAGEGARRPEGDGGGLALRAESLGRPGRTGRPLGVPLASLAARTYEPDNPPGRGLRTRKRLC